MANKKVSKRDLVLLAGNNIVLEQGLEQLTLEAVAKQAGVSKGGLLYHFPDKETLMQGIIQRSLEDFERTVDDLYTTLPDVPGRWLRAFVMATFDDDRTTPRAFIGMTTAIASRPDLLALLQSTYSDWMERAIQSGVTPETARLVIVATNGVWLERIFWEDAGQDHLKDSLLNLISESVDGEG
ncbi:MAG: TetR/AcrR family transcriptional regulator [Chloroflexota bacterium]